MVRKSFESNDGHEGTIRLHTVYMRVRLSNQFLILLLNENKLFGESRN